VDVLTRATSRGGGGDEVWLGSSPKSGSVPSGIRIRSKISSQTEASRKGRGVPPLLNEAWASSHDM